MKWNKCFFSLLLLFLSVGNVMADSIYVEQREMSRFDKREHRYRKNWGALIPTQIVAQNAGNMGFLSAGIGWDYGKRKQWETHLLFGYIPKYQSTRGKLSMTLKENYIPWSIDMKHGLSIEPLRCGLYVNTVYGHEFWKSQPSRYPDDYYAFLSTKFRLNVFLGQQITINIPQEKRKLLTKSITAFYEISTCDLYIRAKVVDDHVSLMDILGLSIGLKLQML